MFFKAGNNRKIGTEKEKKAGRYLETQGYHILEYNFYSRYGEIDLVAKDGEYLVFAEVKYRSSEKNGYPEEAVDTRKRKKIIRTAQFYLLKNGLSVDIACRFDVVVILKDEVRLIKDAFCVDGYF